MIQFPYLNIISKLKNVQSVGCVVMLGITDECRCMALLIEFTSPIEFHIIPAEGAVTVSLALRGGQTNCIIPNK